MKKISLMLMALGLVATSCTKDDFDNVSYMNTVKENYNDMFTLTFGDIAPGHDWGFSSSTGNRAAMRAAFTDKWTDNHSCNWESELTFTKPANAVDVTKPNFDKSGSVYYIPETFKGELNLEWLGLNEGAELYNYGTVTAINNVNYNGVITLYNAGTITNFGPTSGGRHKVVNTGSLTVCGYANIGDLYNSGTLVCEREHNPWWPNEGAKLGTIDHDVSIYSAGEDAVITMPDGCTKLDAKLDVHNKIYVDGDMEFQNDDQTRYVCELEVTGELYLNKGALYTASIKAGSIKMNAFPLYLRQGAHVVTGNFDIDPEGTHVYGHTNSNALIEVESFTFKNKNDLTHTFSDNIYFKVSDYIQINGCYKNAHSDGSGQDHKYTNMADYLANTEDEYHLVAGRLNAGNATGTPACGSAWTIGNSNEEDPGNKPEDDPKDDPKDEPKDDIIYGEQKMIIAEDLAAGRFNPDFDFNDVVFLAQVNVENVGGVPHYIAHVEVLAAGGTLPLYIGIPDPEKGPFDNSHEVHCLFGEDITTTINMINTGTSMSKDIYPTPKIENIDLGAVGDGGTDSETLVKKINEIHVVVVSSTTGPYELTTDLDYSGGYEPTAPMKIAVPVDFQWTQERTPINDVYNDFSKYVQDKEKKEWYMNKNQNKLDLLYKRSDNTAE